MKFFQAILCLIAIYGVTSNDVLDYTDSNFDDLIRTHEVALVKFYAPWCGHCKSLAPEYDIAATTLKSNDPPVALIKVDCTVETKTCQKFGVSGYPTLKIFKNGELSADYQGPRKANGIVSTMKSKAGPVVKDLNTVAEAEKFLGNSEHSIVGFFKSADSKLAKEFKKTADQLSEKYRFAVTTNAEILAKYKYEDKIVIFQPPQLQVKLEASENVYSGSEDSSSIKSFITKEIYGIVGYRTSQNADEFKTPLVIVMFPVDYVRDIKGSNYVRNRVIKVAKKLKDEGLLINFAISNINEMRQELSEHGIEEPAVDGKYIIAKDAQDKKYKFDGEYSPENLEQFVRDFVAGKIQAHLKSEPIPESNPDAVITVVGKSFDQIVNDETKDVLIEFYAPWCGHCKTLAPKYEELAQKLKDETDIVIAKIDATANDIPKNYQVSGFPTLFFAPKNNKMNPKKYDGGREVKDFIKYLAKEATSPMKNFDRNGKATTKADL